MRRRQRLQHDSRMLGGSLELGDKPRVFTCPETQLQLSLHRLRFDRYASVDFRGAVPVKVAGHCDLRAFKLETEQIGNRAKGRLQAGGTCGTQDIPGVDVS